MAVPRLQGRDFRSQIDVIKQANVHSTGLRKSRGRDAARPRLGVIDLKNASKNARQSSTTFICLTQNARGLESETWQCHISTARDFRDGVERIGKWRASSFRSFVC